MEVKHELETKLLQVMEMYRYRGCIVTKMPYGWDIFGQKVSSPEEVDEVIDKAGSILSESIVNTGNYSCINSLDAENLEDNLLDKVITPTEKDN